MAVTAHELGEGFVHRWSKVLPESRRLLPLSFRRHFERHVHAAMWPLARALRGTAPNVELDDLPLRVAETAYAGTSHFAERRAAEEQRNYVTHMDDVWRALQGRAESEEELEVARTLFSQYKSTWLARYLPLLQRRASLVSTLVAGPANFPVERQRRKNDAFERRMAEFNAWDAKEQGVMLDAVHPRPPVVISTDRADAPELIKAKIADLEVWHQRMKQGNPIIRSARSDVEKIAELSKLGFSDDEIRRALTAIIPGRPYGFSLDHSSRTIQYYKKRLAALEKERGRTGVSFEFGPGDADPGGQIIDNPEANRIQIRFANETGRVSRPMYDKLKGAGFKQTRDGIWQSWRTNDTRYKVERILGVSWPEDSAPVAAASSDAETEIVAFQSAEEADEVGPEAEQESLPTDSRAARGFFGDIERLAETNEDFRRILYTGKNLQLVLMTLQPGEQVGEEIHHDRDQFFRIEDGNGVAVINGGLRAVKAGDAVLVPQGARHNIRNTSKAPLKFYSLYAPPEHRDGIVRHTPGDARHARLRR